MSLKQMYVSVIKNVVAIISLVVIALVGVQISVTISNRTTGKMNEMISLSNSIMQNNDNLIKLIRVYIINDDKEAFDTYNNILSDPASFDNKLDRMIEIGLDKTELSMVNHILSLLDTLAEIEDAAIAAKQGDDHEAAVSILFGTDYISADKVLSQETIAFIEHIENRFEHLETVIQRWVSAILMLTFMLLSIAIVVIIRTQLRQRARVLNPIKKIGEIADKIAIGDINVSLQKEYDDEIGMLVDSFNNMAENIRKQAGIVQQMADGDYVVNVQMRSPNDVLNAALRDMVGMTSRTLSRIQKTANEVNEASSNIECGNNTLAEATTEQLESVTGLANMISELFKESEKSAENANQAQNLATKIRLDADTGNSTMKQMVDKMSEIQKATDGISEIMKAIEDISAQTNLLALNASIEAARAGEHGKGFAVVANEVRSLANKSRDAVKQSASIISQAIDKSVEGADMSNQAASALLKIVLEIDNISDVVGTISETLHVQSNSIGGIHQEIRQITDIIQEITSSSEQSASSSALLSSEVDELNQLVSLYKIN